MCTLEKRGSLFILTLTTDDDDQHRLNPTLISSLLTAITQIKSQATDGSALVTAAHGRFFCNGFDFDYARAAGSVTGSRTRLRHMSDSLRPVIAALFSLPMPTVAAVSGHAAAAGLILALAHDYVVMRSDRGVLYLPEMDLGITLPDYFAAVARAKIAPVQARRDLVLRGVKVRAVEALEMGIVHSAHDSAESTVEAAMRLGEELAGRKWVGEAYGEIRKSLYPEVCSVLGLTLKPVISKI
ncbi:enoyl-CoA delta isomerase 2, peroxisomal-like [Lotus japonicus]|uniref:enoyl-CoA delta isomerase 2, peroxisomal-like n=1 Tax=Lotus japonicus TaxID=34305 RepID=UPI002586D70C|nr:enoyl-CoA delta isomerase 2, peroxisomal-like [Lotus japonicus]